MAWIKGTTSGPTNSSLVARAKDAARPLSGWRAAECFEHGVGDRTVDPAFLIAHAQGSEGLMRPVRRLSSLHWTKRTEGFVEYLGSKGYGHRAGFVANLDYCSRETGLPPVASRILEDYRDRVWGRFHALYRPGQQTRLVDPGVRVQPPSEEVLGDRNGRYPAMVQGTRQECGDGQPVVSTSLSSWGARPFFASLNYNDAHSPYEVPDRSLPASLRSVLTSIASP